MSETAETRARALRILMYTAYFEPEYSGAALQALTLARELRRRGHHVEFLTNRWPGLSPYTEVEGFSVWRVEPGRARKHREFRLWANLARFVWGRRRDFDILHSHGAYYTHAFIGPLGRIAGLRTLAKASLTNDDLLDLHRPLIGTLHRWMLRSIDACVAISRDLEQEFRNGGLDERKIHHLPNGVDTGRYRPCGLDHKLSLRAALGLPCDRPIVLYVGVLDERKNISWFADQWVRQDAFGTNALLLVVGPQSREDQDGVLIGRLSELSRSAPERIRLHDFAADIVSYYQCADALILPSLKEGLPNVVLEAMACGLPCIAARASGTRELIVEGETGFTYAHGEVREMGEVVRECLSPRGHALGEKGRALAESRYSIQVIAARYEAVYAHLAGLAEARLRSVGQVSPARMSLLMVTELFLPTKGGTATSFDDDFRRLGGKEVHIVTARVPGCKEFDSTHPNTVHRLVLERKPWLTPESLVMYVKLFARSFTLACSRPVAAVFAGRALPEGIVAWAVGRLRGCKVLVYAHGEELTGWGRGRKFKIMCFALRQSDHILANSDFTRDTLISLIGVRPEQIVMTYPTVDVERYRPGLPFEDLRAGLGLRPEQPLILSVGRLQRRKGFDQVVRSLPGLVRRKLDVHYAIIGIGDDREYLAGIARDLGVTDRLHLLGHVEAADLPRWYNACQVFAMPNRDIAGDTEGFGLVFMEANACGKPVIAGQAGGTGSAVEDGLNGLRINGEVVEAVEEGLARLLLDPAAAARMGQAGRERTASRFTSDQRAEIIRRLIGCEVAASQARW